jgi:outer membrane protein
MKYKNTFLLIAGLFASILLGAQEIQSWSLEQCISYAHNNNISIKRQLLNTQYQETQLKQSKLDRLPNLNANMGYGFNFGFTWVQEDVTNFDGNSSSFNTGISSNMPVFAGMNKQNAIKRDELNLLAALEDAEKLKNDIALQITSQYLQILFDKELLAVAREQLETTNLQVERTKKLVDAGSQAMGSYLEIKSQSAKEALNVTQQENNLGISILNLAQLLDLENPLIFDVQTPDIPELAEFNLGLPQGIYETALGIMPQIKSSEHNLNRSEYDLKLAKGNHYPRLDVNLSLGARANWFDGAGSDVNRPLFDQLNSTSNTYVGASLQIPIFNKLQVRNGVSNAKLGVDDARYQLEMEQLNLRKEIQQAYADALAAYKKYLSSEEAVESYKESFRYTEKKFNVGLVNSVDYNVAKTDFTRAQSNLLQSKYEYILRTKILDFYRGIPIKL